MIVAAGDAKIDNAKYKAVFGVKAKMLSADEAEACIGHAVGRRLSLCRKRRGQGLSDQSLKRFGTVFPGLRQPNSAIELTPQELEQYGFPDGWMCSGF